MKRLRMVMYYSRAGSQPSDLFGLCCGQLRSSSERMIKNAGWYNKQGEKLGWGDLGIKDINRITAELEENEVFVLLGEQDSFWKFVTAFPDENKPQLGRFCKTDYREKSPGVEYVAEKCWFIIKNGTALAIYDHLDLQKYLKEYYQRFFKSYCRRTNLPVNFDLKTISRTEARNLLLS